MNYRVNTLIQEYKDLDSFKRFLKEENLIIQENFYQTGYEFINSMTELGDSFFIDPEVVLKKYLKYIKKSII